MTPMLRTLLPLALLTLAAAAPAQPVAQTPITVEVVNDSGLNDAQVYLLLSGQDIGNTPAGQPGTYYPFSVSGVATSPSGLLVGTTGTLSTANGGNIAPAAMPIFVAASASPVAMAFSPAAIPADGATTSTLTIALPNSGTAPGSTLVQSFVVTMPTGVTISPPQDTGNCGITTVTATTITIGPGSSIPNNGCSIIVTVTATAVGNYAVWTPWLQTGGNFAPTVAPLAVTNSATGLAASFGPATVTAGGTTTLTLTLPSPGNATTLSSAFTTTLPGSMFVAATPAPTSTCATQPTVTANTITLPAGMALAAPGCTVTVAVVAAASSGSLSNLTNTGRTATSPYTGAQLPVYAFTMNTVGSGNLYLSYNAPLTLPSAPTVRTPTRFQSLEFSYSAAIASNGDLTSIDFFGIPLELSTHDPNDRERTLATDRVTYYTSTPTLINAMLTDNPELQCAILRTDGAPFDPSNPLKNFARIVGPNQLAAGGTPPVIQCPTSAPSNWTGGTWPPTPPAGSPWPYTSFAAYLDALATAPAYTFVESDTNIISSYTFNYTGTVAKMGAVTVTSTTSSLTTSAGTLPAASAPLSVIPGTTAGASSPTMTFSPATIAAGGSTTLTISLPNATGAAYTLSAPFYDVMPPGAIITSIPAGGTCTGVSLQPAAAPVQIALGAGASIPAGGCTIVVTVTSSRVGTVTNTTSMLQPTGAAAMPLAAAPLTVVPSQSTRLLSSIVPGTIAPGGTATWMISLGHSGTPATTLTAAFTGSLPAGVTTTSGNTGTCTGATVSSTQVGLPSGTTIPAGGCTIVATITSTAQGGVNGTLPSCLDPKLAADGWLIRLTGTTAASGLPSNADLCIPLARHDNGYGSADFVIYGAAQNCETLGLASGGVLQPCSDQNAAALGSVANSVYGWMQADVLSALNFGYMQGAADQTYGGGQSQVWYGVPPVQYPFGQARTTNDGFYNAWAATMYNHSDAYGFAFSDRNGRPSPDIAFPTDGGTLRVWILPDARLDAPMVTTSQNGDCATVPMATCTLTLSWNAVANADHYVVTWSPPYAMQSVKVPQASGTVSYGLAGLTPGTPYMVTVRAVGTNSALPGTPTIKSFEVPVYATTQGATPAPAAGNAFFQFGFNWTAPAFLANAPSPPTLTVGGQTATLSGGTFTIPNPTPITVGPSPASAALTVTPAAGYSSLSVVASIGTVAGGSAPLTVTLGNGTGSTATLTQQFQIVIPDGVTAALGSGTTCVGVVAPAPGAVPQAILMGTVGIPAGGCTINATLTAASPGSYVIPTSTLVAGANTAPAGSTVLAIPGGSPAIAQSIAPASIAPGGQATLTTTLGTAASPAAALVESFVDDLPVGWTIIGSNTGTCPQVALTTTQIRVPAGTVLPAGGCTIVTTISAQTPGTLANTTGTLLTAYPTQAFPMLINFGGSTIWAANFYLTMMGTPTDYSVGTCPATANCIGSGLPNPVAWDTVTVPNFLERQGGALSVSGGVAAQGPPFGGTVNNLADVSVSFTPVPNKLAAPVVYPGAGSAP